MSDVLDELNNDIDTLDSIGDSSDDLDIVDDNFDESGLDDLDIVDDNFDESGLDDLDIVDDGDFDELSTDDNDNGLMGIGLIPASSNSNSLSLSEIEDLASIDISDEFDELDELDLVIDDFDEAESKFDIDELYARIDYRKKLSLDFIQFINVGTSFFWDNLTAVEMKASEIDENERRKYYTEIYNKCKRHFEENNIDYSLDYICYCILFAQIIKYNQNNRAKDNNPAFSKKFDALMSYIQRLQAIFQEKPKEKYEDYTAMIHADLAKLSENLATSSKISSLLINDKLFNNIKEVIKAYITRNQTLKEVKTNADIELYRKKIDTDNSVINKCINNYISQHNTNQYRKEDYNPDDDLFNFITSLKFNPNGIQTATCSCGECTSGEDLIVKFLIPQEYYTYPSINTNDEISIITDRILNTDAIYDNIFNIEEYEDTRTCIGLNGISKDIEFNANLYQALSDSAGINGARDYLNVIIASAANIKFEIPNCSSCGKYMLLPVEDMRFFFTYHNNNIKQERLVQLKRCRSTRSYQETKDVTYRKSPTYYRYKANKLQDNYNTFLEKFKSAINSPEYKDVQDLDKFKEVINKSTTEINPVVDSDINEILSNLTKTAWLYVKDNYNDFEDYYQQYVYDNNDGYMGKSCKDGYYPYINFLKIALSEYLEPEVYSLQNVAKRFVSPSINPAVYYGLIYRKYYNKLMFVIDSFLMFTKAEDGKLPAYFDNQIYNSFADRKDSCANHIRTIKTIYDEFTSLVDTYLESNSKHLGYTYIPFVPSDNQQNLSDDIEQLTNIKNMLNTVYENALEYPTLLRIYRISPIDALKEPNIDKSPLNDGILEYNLHNLNDDTFLNRDKEFDITTCFTDGFDWRMHYVIILSCMLYSLDSLSYRNLIKYNPENKDIALIKYIRAIAKKYGLINNNPEYNYHLSLIAEALYEDYYGSKRDAFACYNMYDYSTLLEYPCEVIPNEFTEVITSAIPSLTYGIIKRVTQCNTFEEAIDAIKAPYADYVSKHFQDDAENIPNPSDYNVCKDAVSDVINCYKLLADVKYLSDKFNSHYGDDVYFVNELELKPWAFSEELN